jgi:cytochrome bd-type quinol oxidase subunit 2
VLDDGANHPDATGSPVLLVRRALLVAGLAAVTWSAGRVVLLLAGSDDVVADDDPHGYAAIFSLFLLPVLILAAALLVRDALDVWRPSRSHRVGGGVALTVSAPLAGPLAIPVAVLGVAIAVAAIVHKRHS